MSLNIVLTSEGGIHLVKLAKCTCAHQHSVCLFYTQIIKLPCEISIISQTKNCRGHRLGAKRCRLWIYSFDWYDNWLGKEVPVLSCYIINYILDLHRNKKSEVDSHIFKTEFLEIKSAYKHYMSIYTDGSKQDEKVACAVISPNFTDSIRLPDNSSIFTAEAKAIDIALYHIRDQPEKQFIIYSDSLSVLRSLKNLDHRNPLIQQIFRKYNYLSACKEIVFCWLPSHTNIRGNELADLEAKSALSLSITNLKIPHSDFKSNIHQYVMNTCQSVWEKQTGNK